MMTSEEMDALEMETHELQCHVYKCPDNDGFYAAEIWSASYGDIRCLARDRIRAEGFAWRELGERMIKRTQTPAYKAVMEVEDGYVS